jgi:VWFA-related protein
MKTRLFLVVLLSVAAHAAASLGSPGRPQAVFRTGVDLVRLDALVTSGGRPVTGLNAGDFAVTDNGVPQQLKMATTEGDVAVALVLDTSGSVKGSALDHLVAASQTLVAMLKPGDTVSLVTFSNRLSLEAGSVRDPTVISHALLDARSAGRTALWDALLAGVSLVAGRTQRSLVLAFTDGSDNSSWITREQLVESLKRSEAVVYAVQSGDWGKPEPGAPLQTARRSLQSVVNQAGGDVFQAESGIKLSQQFTAILEQFRSRYLLTYEPAGVRRDDGWHRVDVRVKGRQAKVVVRPGYYAKTRPE